MGVKERLSVRRKEKKLRMAPSSTLTSDAKYGWGVGDCDLGVWEDSFQGQNTEEEIEKGWGVGEDFNSWGEVELQEGSESIGSWGDSSSNGSGRNSRGSGWEEPWGRNRKHATSLDGRRVQFLKKLLISSSEFRRGNT